MLGAGYALLSSMVSLRRPGGDWSRSSKPAGVIELSISDADVAKPMSIAQSRVQRARILLGYREDPSFFAVARAPELWDGIIRRFSGALSNRTDCPPITRSSGSGDLSAISQVTR
jgi:hypothetical protein